jgi:sec-independent protein translocase protein TatA
MGLGLENPLHILIVLVVVLLVFGAKRLPEMGHSLGAGLRGFKESLTGQQTAPPVVQLNAAASESHQASNEAGEQAAPDRSHDTQR